MGLLTKKLIRELPELYSTEHEPLGEKMALAKFFHSWSGWTWYIIEFDKDDLCWGLVKGHETEFGYFSLSELSKISALLGLQWNVI